MLKKKNCACENPDCSISTGYFMDELTFGSGVLDDFGYWEKPCYPCARAWETTHPGSECWPYRETSQHRYEGVRASQKSS